MKDYYVGFDMNVILLLTGELSEILEKELIERSKELHGYNCCLTRKYPK